MLSQKIKERLSTDSGFCYEKFIRLSPFAEKKVIENLTGRELSVSKKRDYRISCDEPFISRKRIKTIDEVDKELSEIHWDW